MPATSGAVPTGFSADLLGNASLRANSLFLKHDVGIGLQVGHVNLLSILDDFRMLPAHQPANVGEEEAAIGIVRICVGVRVLVVLTVIPDPYPEAVLSCQCVHVEQEDAHPLVGLKGSMGPQAMRTHSHPLSRRVH